MRQQSRWWRWQGLWGGRKVQPPLNGGCTRFRDQQNRLERGFIHAAAGRVEIVRVEFDPGPCRPIR